MELPDPQYKTPEGAALRIWRDPAQNKFQSERHGRPIFDEVIYCEMITPGSRDSTPVFELVRKFCDEMEHPEPLYGPKYDELKQYVVDFERSEQTDSSLAGTPLTQWPEMNRSLVATLKAQGVFTVDALAELPDTKLNIVGPDGRSWRAKAKAYIESAKDGSYATELAGRVEVLETALAAGAERERTLAARVQELETANAKGATAPAKAKAAPAPADAVTTANGAPAAVATAGETLVAAGETKATQSII